MNMYNFEGYMVTHAYVNQDDSVHNKIGIRFTTEGAAQDFINGIEQDMGITNIKSLFNVPVPWKRVSLDLSPYADGNEYTVQFDDVEFDAVLKEVVVSHKSKDDGTEVFDYTLVFFRDFGEDGPDHNMAKMYLKYKEEDEEGKMKLKAFNVKLTHFDQYAIDSNVNML